MGRNLQGEEQLTRQRVGVGRASGDREGHRQRQRQEDTLGGVGDSLVC